MRPVSWGGGRGRVYSKLLKPSLPSGGFASPRTVGGVLNRRPSAGEMKAQVDKGRVKGIDSTGMQGKCDR